MHLGSSLFSGNTVCHSIGTQHLIIKYHNYPKYSDTNCFSAKLLKITFGCPWICSVPVTAFCKQMEGHPTMRSETVQGYLNSPCPNTSVITVSCSNSRQCNWLKCTNVLFCNSLHLEIDQLKQ